MIALSAASSASAGRRRLATLSLDTVLKLIQPRRHPARIEGIPDVRVGIKRLLVFKQKGVVCMGCGLPGTHFAIEQSPQPDGSWGRPHLNLYSLAKGKEVLMTVDHIVARADGGSKEMSNLQTMCAPCNEAKGSIKAIVSNFKW